jgi:hypothetical protein
MDIFSKVYSGCVHVADYLQRQQILSLISLEINLNDAFSAKLLLHHWGTEATLVLFRQF